MKRAGALVLAALTLLGWTHAAEPPQSDPLDEIARFAQSVSGAPAEGQKSVSLDTLLQQTANQNPEVRQAAARLGDAQGQAMVLRARRLPRATILTLAGRQGERSNRKARNFFVVPAQFSQPLFEAGIPASVRRANVLELIGRQNFFVTLTEKLYATRLAYLQAARARGLVRLYDEQAQIVRKNEEDQNQRLQAGLVARSSLLQATLQTLNLGPKRAEAQKARSDALLELVGLTGSDLRQDPELLFPEGSLDFVAGPIDVEAAVKTALTTRPDLLLLRDMLQAAREDVRIAQAGYYPAISLIGNAQYVPSTTGRDTSSNAVRARDSERISYIQGGPAFSWQVIDNGRTGGPTASAKKRRESAEAALADLETDIPHQIAAIAQSLSEAQNEARTLAEALAKGREILKLVVAQVDAGEATQLDFLNAQENLFNLRTNLLEALFRQNKALADYELATGGYVRYRTLP